MTLLNTKTGCSSSWVRKLSGCFVLLACACCILGAPSTASQRVDQFQGLEQVSASEAPAPREFANKELPSVADDERVEDESHAEEIVGMLGGDGGLTVEQLDGMMERLNGESGGARNHGRPGEKNLTPAKLLKEFGKDGTLNSTGLEHACTTILQCQVDESCELLSDDFEEETDSNIGYLRLTVAIALTVEVIAGAILVTVLGYKKVDLMWLGLLNVFAGGVFFGTGLLHLIAHVLEAQAKISGLNDFPLGMLIVAFGFMAILFMEHILCDVHSSVDDAFRVGTDSDIEKRTELLTTTTARLGARTNSWESLRKPTILLLAISFHAILEAVEIGLEEGKSGLLIIFTSVASHKGIVAIALSARFLQNGASVRQVIVLMIAFAFVTPLGILIGWVAGGANPYIELVMNGLATGTFLYVGGYEIIAEEFGCQKVDKESRMFKILKFVSIFSGLVMIALVQLISDH